MEPSNKQYLELKRKAYFSTALSFLLLLVLFFLTLLMYQFVLAENEQHIAQIYLVSGVVVSVSIFFATLFSARSRLEAIQLAEEMTQKLVEAAEKTKQQARQIDGQKRYLELLLDNLPVGVYLVDADSHETVFMNEKLRQIFSSVVDFDTEIMGKHTLFDFLEDEEGNKCVAEEMPVAITLREEQPASATGFYLRRQDSVDSVLSFASNPIRNIDGKIVSVVVVVEDVTHEYEVDKSKTELISLVSHQLRTPISTIAWYAELLLGNELGKIRDDQAEFIQQIHDSSTWISEMITTLLNISRIELGTLAVEPKMHDIHALISDVLGEVQPRIKEKNISLKQSYEKDEESLRIDSALLKIVLQNLVTNAVKYTKDNGTVTITTNEKEGNFVISVTDTGIGIPSEQQSQVFKKMFRADNAKKMEADGTGLGLYSCKALMTKSGGDVTFESEEGVGTTFYIKIPIEGMKQVDGSKVLSNNVSNVSE